VPRGVDPSGYKPTVLGAGCTEASLSSITGFCERVKKLSASDKEKIVNCMSKKKYSNQSVQVELALRAISSGCADDSICIMCVSNDESGKPVGWPSECPSVTCGGPFPPTGFTWSNKISNGTLPFISYSLLGEGCEFPGKFPEPYQNCREALRKNFSHCKAIIELCPDVGDTKRVGIGFVFIYELVHAVGMIAHPGSGKDWLRDLDNCMEDILVGDSKS
jgi:hypothetical protein